MQDDSLRGPRRRRQKLDRHDCGAREPGGPAEVVRDLDEARLLGNWSLQKGLSFSYAEVADVASLIKEAAFLL